eukprot:CAMPEP_0115250862 /NCGR_PEP_ID=MMETSP0270-20121206/43332_1 /TAXON_ID=71861 /ORGANISM="Scrippsiella trochoidea, Strain CCMP3099" /LENGTH=555 /DNA_ID=CAMNT_0002666263 /DNA_START=69 /DNA_END=1732 /DNA_ORIENTATION=+
MALIASGATKAGPCGRALWPLVLGAACLCGRFRLAQGGPAAGAISGTAARLPPGDGTLSQDHVLLSLPHGLVGQLSKRQGEGHLHGWKTALPPGPLGSDRAGVEQLLAATQLFATRVSNGTAQEDETMPAVLVNIHQAMETVVSGLVAEHNTTQHFVDLANHSIRVCDAHLQPVVGAEAAREEHVACRSTEAKFNETRRKSCDNYQRVLLDRPGVPECEPDYLDHPERASYEAAASFMERWSDWLGTWNTTLRQSRTSCNQASTLHSAQVKQCEQKQVVFETKFCDRVGACPQYIACRSSSEADQESAHADAKVTEAGMQATHVAARRVQCYIKVVQAAHEARPALLASCSSLQPSTSHLAIVYGRAPARSSCEALQGDPCDAEWRHQHYGTEDWYMGAPPMASCSTCRAMCSIFFCPSGMVVRPHADELQGSDRETCCEASAPKITTLAPSPATTTSPLPIPATPAPAAALGYTLKESSGFCHDGAWDSHHPDGSANWNPPSLEDCLGRCQVESKNGSPCRFFSYHEASNNCHLAQGCTDFRQFAGYNAYQLAS